MKRVLITLSALSVLSLSGVALAGPSGNHPFNTPRFPAHSTRVVADQGHALTGEMATRHQAPKIVWTSSHSYIIVPAR